MFSGCQNEHEWYHVTDFPYHLSGLSKEIYEERVTKLAQNCALFAKEQQVKLYVELSSAQVYGSSGKTSKVSTVIDDVCIIWYLTT